MRRVTRSRLDVARTIDHTLLKPEATAAQIAALCLEATKLGVAAVCVSPTRVALADSELTELVDLDDDLPRIAVASVIGFPSGAHLTAVKAAEAEQAVQSGANEIDMVIDLGAAAEGHWSAVERDIAAVRLAGGAALLKVIFESALLDAAGIIAACRASEAAGADFVKTSTGFHPAGGASLDAVRLMAETVDGRLGVKASGGIRTGADAVAYLDAGATRLGLSASRAVLDSLPE